MVQPAKKLNNVPEFGKAVHRLESGSGLAARHMQAKIGSIVCNEVQ